MRWVIRLAGVLAGLAALFLLALVMLPRDRLAALAAREFEEATGRALSISGEVRPSVWPLLGVRTGPVTVANAAWSPEGPMLEAASLEIGLDTLGLMTGVWRIRRIALETPVIRLERDREGRANWDFGDDPAPQGPEGAPAPGRGRGDLSGLALDEAVVRGGRVIWIDRRAGSRLEIGGIEATASLPEAGGAADLTLAGETGGHGFAVEGTVGEAAAFLAGRLAPVRLTGVTGAARLAFDGQLGLAPPMADGRVEATLGDLSDVMALAGRPRPDLPEGLGRRGIEVKGQVTLADGGSLHLRDGEVRLDANRLAVEADLTPGEDRPKLEANLRTEALELPAAAGPSGRAGRGDGSAGSGNGWSKEPIDVSALGRLDAAVALSAGRVVLGRLTLGPTKAILTLERSRAALDLREVAAYGGRVTGDLVANGRGGLSVAADLTLSGLQAEPLLADLLGFDRLSTTGDARLEVGASGLSVDALMRSLSGAGSVRFGTGEWRGLDVAGMVRTFDPGYVGEGRKTVFDSLTASFSIDRGVLRNRDLALAAPLLRATGAGEADLGDRTIDYRLLPTLLPRADGKGGVTVPLLIAGPWASPRYKLDMEALVREPVGRAAEERLKDEAARRLGIEPDEGESLEQAAKRRAREALEAEAARALGRMLGGN